MPPRPRETEIRRIGRQLRLLRERSGRSIAQLSRAASLSEHAIRQLEAGRTNPSLATVVAIADVLGVKLNDLVDAARRNVVISVYTPSPAANKISVDLTCELPEPRMRARIIRIEGDADVPLPPAAVFGHALGDGITVSLDGEETVLRRGDSFHARAGVLRGWRGQPASGRLLVVETDEAIQPGRSSGQEPI